MGKKILIVGGVAGGASAATRLRRQSEEDVIIMFEKGPHVSFSNCSLPYHLSGIIKDAEDLVLMNPEIFLKQYNIIARVNSEVMSIDKENKKILVKDYLEDKIYEEEYDVLILSPGATPFVPEIKGISNIPVFTIRNVVDIDKLNRYINENSHKDITVVGGGFIGIEVAENLRKASLNVNLVEFMNQILRNIDYDMVQILHKELYDNGVNLILEDSIKEITDGELLLNSGKVLKADLLVMAAGVLPDVKLAKEAGLEIGETGAILTDDNYRSSDPFIYAVGDAIEIENALLGTKMKLPLAGPALKQARAVADNINNKKTKNNGYISSSAIRVFKYNAASTGLSEGLIKALKVDIKYDIVRLILNDKVGLMPDASPMHFKLLYEKGTGKVLGAQAIGKGDVTKRVDIIATVIKFGGDLEDLKDLELCYAPPFSTAKDIVNYAGYAGSNLLEESFKQVNVDVVRELVENNAFIVDVREKYEFNRGHLINAVNIPLSELRQRVSEIPKNQKVYIHCRSGQRSYNAVRALINLGYTEVYNITGSFLGISLYEYFNDITKDREKIVTEYNFM
jgi:NADPH-dependent 2,4-dienoyl-CoA reductase/sulfur reductase-like enzyme/rhodanese-related sulfurtransferase